MQRMGILGGRDFKGRVTYLSHDRIPDIGKVVSILAVKNIWVFTDFYRFTEFAGAAFFVA